MSEKEINYIPERDEKQFVEPFIDMDEIRVTSGVKFRWFHGGFKNTALKFSFCFPSEVKDFNGRFFQYLSPFPGPDEEMASLGKTGMDDMIAFAVKHGAAFVESNMASSSTFGGAFDPTEKYRSSACTAEYCRRVAKEIYGYDRHVYGYVFGGSGGAYKTFSCIEQTNAWEGAVPVVPGCPMALPNVIFVRAHAQRVLRHKMEDLLDAIRPGSDHGYTDHMNAEEKAAFEEVTKMGYPPEAWLQYIECGDGSLAVLAPSIKMMDRDYFTDFWTKEGYLGTEENSSAVKDRIQIHTKIAAIHIGSENDEIGEINSTQDTMDDGANGVNSAWKKMLQESAPGHPWIMVSGSLGEDPYAGGLKIKIESGEAKGKELTVSGILNERLYIGNGLGQGSVAEILGALSVNDEVYLDNSDYIAIQTYHRHQVPGEEYKVWDQFRKEDGTPKYPQRGKLLGYGFAMSGAGSLQNGRPNGKVISMASLADDSAFPWMADWYAGKIKENYGDQADGVYRLYYNEHAHHGYDAKPADPTTVSTYLPQLYQALLDVSDWVERGIAPCPSSCYTVEDGQVYVPDTAEERNGIQPLVHLTAKGEKRVEIQKGDIVTFKAEAAMPKGAGKILGADFTGYGNPEFPEVPEVVLSKDGTHADVTISCVYSTPGTYFATVRIKSQRHGDTTDPYTRIQNIDQVRVVVK